MQSSVALSQCTSMPYNSSACLEIDEWSETTSIFNFNFPTGYTERGSNSITTCANIKLIINAHWPLNNSYQSVTCKNINECDLANAFEMVADCDRESCININGQGRY